MTPDGTESQTTTTVPPVQTPESQLQSDSLDVVRSRQEQIKQYGKENYANEHLTTAEKTIIANQEQWQQNPQAAAVSHAMPDTQGYASAGDASAKSHGLSPASPALQGAQPSYAPQPTSTIMTPQPQAVMTGNVPASASSSQTNQFAQRTQAYPSTSTRTAPQAALTGNVSASTASSQTNQFARRTQANTPTSTMTTPQSATTGNVSTSASSAQANQFARQSTQVRQTTTRTSQQVTHSTANSGISLAKTYDNVQPSNTKQPTAHGAMQHSPSGGAYHKYEYEQFQKPSTKTRTGLNNAQSIFQIPIDLITSVLNNYGVNSLSRQEIIDFALWYKSSKSIYEGWKLYQKENNSLYDSEQQQLNALPLSFPNGQKGEPYEHTIKLDPSKVSIKEILIESLPADFTSRVDCGSGEITLKGTPTEARTFEFKLRIKSKASLFGNSWIERKFSIIINPNSEDLWVNKPVPSNIAFPKADEYCDFIPASDGATKTVVAASKRGRIHAQEGRPRDDDFCVRYYPDNKWYLLAVADGAGSAKYSREGSRVACKVVEAYCKEQLRTQGDEFERAIAAYAESRAKEDLNPVATKIGAILINAAKAAYKELVITNQKCNDTVLKDFATTLLLVICRKFSFGWFFASFGVGDGAIAIYDKNSNAIRLLNDPDSGEFAGQTRFLTMDSIFSDKTRSSISIVEDFTALLLMTDGISDPFFDTDENLAQKEKWDALWQNLSQKVNFASRNENVKDQLLKWLDFMRKGYHDDRTIAILY